MFGRTNQMHRRSSSGTGGGYYFLNFLFVLHIYTAWLTIIIALNTDVNDSEAIIQFSTDSIHVLKSSDLHISGIEQLRNEEEEKELVKALLSSYENQSKTSELPDNEILSGIRFIPSLLQFPDQSIAVPRMQTVVIINRYSEPLELYSISGMSNQFYSSVFQENVLPPDGGKTSINIYFLPRTTGPSQTRFTVETSRGNVSFNVNGTGELNPFRLRPLVNALIPFNSTFEYTVHFYNPYSFSLEINEIYTSDENLIIELLSNKNQRNKIRKLIDHHEQWYIKPFETKAIVKINYLARKLNRLNGFICIKTNFSDINIIPVEINVSDRFGLYSNVDLFEFTTNGFMRSLEKAQTKPIYVVNQGLNSVVITDVRVTLESRSYITIYHQKLQISPDVHRLNQIADVTINPNLIPEHIQRVHGFIQVYTSTHNQTPALEIPFDEKVMHGTLDYEKKDTLFYISSLRNKPIDQQTEQCQPVRLINRYQVPIAVYNITVNAAELVSHYLKITLTSSVVHFYYGQWTELFCITLLKLPTRPVSFDNFQAVVGIHSNLSFFTLPIQLYNGILEINILPDYVASGILLNKTGPLELSIASIALNTFRTVTFLIQNANPIEIAIIEFDSTLTNTIIKLDQLTLLDGSETTKKMTNSYKNNNISQLVIPEQHQAVFSFTIHAINPPQFYHQSIKFETLYQTLHINVKYQITNGSVEFANETLHLDSSPNRVATTDIFLHNKFLEPVMVTRMDFMAYGVCFSFNWTTTINGRVELEPNKTQRLGKLNFDLTPFCKTLTIPSEANSYCGMEYHPVFKHQWDEYVSALNVHGLDYEIVIKFRKFWKEWTSLVRKQRIESSIWLYSERANISWPVIITFAWPSVFVHISFPSSSRSPMILDFQVTFVNTTKTQAIVITNPSSKAVTYAVELLETHSNISESILTDHIFTISPTSKRTESINGVYSFTLLPTEQITFTVFYRPKLPSRHEMYFTVRNNFTILESILLRGEGGTGSIQVGNRKAGSSLVPLLMEVEAKYDKLCSSTNGNPVLQKIVTIHNTGNMQTIIHDISFGHSQCSRQGFLAVPCINLEIGPHGFYHLTILFQPDYTTDEVNETLVLNTNIGLLTFPIIVRIPHQVLLACYRILPRPYWEFRTFGLCFCLSFVLILLIFTTAMFDAQRLFENYLTRAELRDRVQTTDNLFFDLSDLSLAVQDEQKTRELMESNPAIDMKKEENKPKRSVTSNRGSTSKSVRNSETSNTTAQSVAVSPKATPSKARRATTDSGPPKNVKHSQEISPRPQPARRQKFELQIPATSRAVLSSSAVSDEENEGFVMARSKRLSSKTKEPPTHVTPRLIVDNTVPVIRKPSSSVELSNQQDLIQCDESSDDQQWRMVSSSKGQRRTTISRRENVEESQPTNKTVQIPSTHPEKPTITPSLSSHAHNSTSHEPAVQSRRHRRSRRRVTRNPPPIPAPSLVKRKSLETDASLVMSNRELAFRQLTEQLWVAGMPSSTMTSSRSIRSRCSSAPPSEHGGGDDHTGKFNWNNDNEDEEENIDWDEPDVPDDGNTGCLSSYSLPTNTAHDAAA